MSAAERIAQWADVPLPLAQLVVSMNRRRGYCDLKHLRSDSRERDAVKVRWAIVAEAHRRGFSYSAIGRALNRDHTTIMHAVREMRG